MKIIPKHKSDLDACKNLKAASDDDVIKALPELLEWLQDLNWPVAKFVLERVHTLGSPLIEPINDILNGNDDVWKYFVVQNLIPLTNNEVKISLKPALVRLANNPTESEIVEEVNLVAQELLAEL